MLVAACSKSPVTQSVVPTDPLVEAVNRGVSRMGQFDYPGGVAAFEAALALRPEQADLKVNLAIALFNRGQKETGDFDRAPRLLDEVLAREPNHLRALYVRGILLQHLGDAAGSVPCFEKVVQARPEDGAAWYLLGLSQQRAGRPAEPALNKAIELKPYLSSAHYKLAQLAMLSGDTNQAARHLEAFKRLRESPLNELIEVPQYGAMGDLALVQPLPFASASQAVPSRYTLAEGRVLFEADGPWFHPPDLRLPLGGAAAGDLDGDGQPDLVFAATGEKADGRLVALLSTTAGPWRDATARLGLDQVREARGIALGDFDNDGLNDLLVVGARANQLFRGVSNAAFVDVSGTLPVPASGPAGSGGRSGFFLDADHDGDLDLLVCASGPAGARNRLFNNNADGTFSDLAATNGLALAGSETVFALPGDLDGDRDLDLVIFTRDGLAPVFLNNLLGNYAESAAELPRIEGGLGGVLQDWDGNGTLDLVALGGEPARLSLWFGDGHGRFHPARDQDELNRTTAAWGTLTALRAADFDLDGDLDLLVLAPEAHLLLNDGTGVFAAQPPVWKVPAGFVLTGVEVADLTGDHVPDLLCFEQGARARVVLYAGRLAPPGTALAVSPTGVRGRDLRTRSPASGFGVSLTARTATREARLLYTGLAGGPNQSVLPAVLGLGGRTKADYLQLLWSDGVAQVESDVSAGVVHRIAELQRKISSCPVLFAWNGERFQFITDFAGVGGLGYFVAPGVAATPQGLEHVKIEPHQIRPRDGFYELRVTEPMEEAAYLDQLELWSVDHPLGTQVFPDERLAVSGPPPTQEWLFVESVRFPLKAVGPSGEDCAARLREADRRYAYAPELDRRFVGFCRPHSLELDFGDALSSVAAGGRLFLFLRGFIEYPYSQTVYAAGQAGVGWEPIRVEAANADGTWRMLVPDAGAPGGMDRMVTVDLTGGLPPTASRLRLTTNLEIGYDQVFVASARTLPGPHNRPVTGRASLLASRVMVEEQAAGPEPRPTGPRFMESALFLADLLRDLEPEVPRTWPSAPRGRFMESATPAPGVQIHRLPLSSATLRWLGFPREVSPDGGQPLIYDYQQIEPTAPFHFLRGDYTRYGAVEELLAASDDQYVIMGSGDELALRFSASTLPPLADGMTRSFILVSRAWCKDLDLYTLEPRTLAPLPFRGMGRYPYPPAEGYPDTPAHHAYLARYNTRSR